MKGSRWLVPPLVVLAVADGVLTLARWPSGRTPAPDVLHVREVVPAEVEPGDRIALIGDGFPAGQPAQVAFRGTFHRPGQPPTRGAAVVLRGTAVSPERVEVPFDEAAQGSFCGLGERKIHTTFEGRVDLAFSSSTPGAPPPSASADAVTIDVRPSSTPSSEARGREGERLVSWLGLDVVPQASGLEVRAVEPSSRAAAAGFVVGDVIVGFDGVRVDGLDDVALVDGEATSRVDVRVRAAASGAGAVVTRHVSTKGFRRPPATSLLPAVLIVVAALAAILTLAVPALDALGPRLKGLSGRPWSLEERAEDGGGAGARDAGSPAEAPDGEAEVGSFLAPAPRWRRRSVRLSRSFAYAVVAALPLGPSLFGSRPDVLLLFVAAWTAGVVATTLTARSLRATAPAAWRALVRQLPAVVAVAASVVMSGSLRLQEIERVQGGSPWEWAGLRHPAALLAAALLWSCAVLDPAMSRPVPPRTGAAPLADAAEPCGEARSMPPVPAPPWFDVVCQAHAVVLSGLTVVLFMGGWLLPGVSPVLEESSVLLAVAGAAWLVAKTWALVRLATWAGRGGPQRFARASQGLALVGAAFSLGTVVAWTRWGPLPAVERLVSAATLVAAVVVVIGVVLRFRWSGGRAAYVRLSPFL